MTKDQAHEWIKSLLERVDSQDCRDTAKPIQFLLQVKREYVAHDEYHVGHTEKVFHHHTFERRQAKSFDEAVQMLFEYGYRDDELEKEKEHIEELDMGHYWETTQAFFSEDGLKRHLEANRHNLGEHRDYVIHAFRNPEFRELFDVLRAVIL